MSEHPWEAPVRRRLHVMHVSMPTSEGTAVVALSYIRDQLERGWNVTVVCPSTGWLGYAARDLGARVRWWSASRDPGSSVIPEAAALSRIVRQSRPDLVHLHSAKAGLVGRLVLRGSRPTIYQPHGWSFLAATGRTRTLAQWWESRATSWTDRLVCVSEDERVLGESAGVRLDTLVLPNGVDLRDRLPQSRQDRQSARAVLRLPEAPLAVCIGRLATQKGQHDLLDVWPDVRRHVPTATLVLVGEGPDRADLEARVAGLEGVTMVGARTDVQTWMAAANVVVTPSRWEGMALVPLEAMAAARSVVTTDVAGSAESVSEEAGAVVPARDPEALAAALTHRLRYIGEADDEGLVGRSHVEAHHDAASSSRELAEACLRMLADRRRS